MKVAPAMAWAGAGGDGEGEDSTITQDHAAVPVAGLGTGATIATTEETANEEQPTTDLQAQDGAGATSVRPGEGDGSDSDDEPGTDDDNDSPVRRSEFRAQRAKLRAQQSELRVQQSELRAQQSELLALQARLLALEKSHERSRRRSSVGAVDPASLFGSAVTAVASAAAPTKRSHGIHMIFMYNATEEETSACQAVWLLLLSNLVVVVQCVVLFIVIFESRCAVLVLFVRPSVRLVLEIVSSHARPLIRLLSDPPTHSSAHPSFLPLLGLDYSPKEIGSGGAWTTAPRTSISLRGGTPTHT